LLVHQANDDRVGQLRAGLGKQLSDAILPHLRGSAPINWALIRGATQTGNTLIWGVPELPVFVPTARHAVAEPQEILLPVVDRSVETAAPGRATAGTGVVAAAALTAGTALPTTAAIATSPVMVILRTAHLP